MATRRRSNRNNEVSASRSRARRYDRQVECILTEHVGQDPRRDRDEWTCYDPELDRDVLVLSRIRLPGYPLTEFTLRAQRPDLGAADQTIELARVLNPEAPWGDYLLYAHERGEHDLAGWVLIDLAFFRGMNPTPKRLQPTRDGTAVFAILDLDRALIRAMSPEVEAALQAREEEERRAAEAHARRESNAERKARLEAEQAEAARHAEEIQALIEQIDSRQVGPKKPLE